MSFCLLAVGSNVGERQHSIDEAIVAVGRLKDTSVEARSGLHATLPIGGPAGQGEFLNGAIVVETSKSVETLHRELQSIENLLGRERRERWSARPIDLDLLLVDDQVLETAALKLPHPRMSFRPFVLESAVEVAGDWRHPRLGCTLDALWTQLRGGDDGLLVYGGTSTDREWHAAQLCTHFASWRSVEAEEGSCWLAAGDVALSDPVSPKLAIQLCKRDEAPQPGWPTLTLPASGRESNLIEAIAAVDGIWPDLGHGEPTV
ncbi:MAG: 2-amino-4-hydroxy-6-hydroxymethyldihydropteridine diphosphokinase [Aeoliella sp.]